MWCVVTEASLGSHIFLNSAISNLFSHTITYQACFNSLVLAGDMRTSLYKGGEMECPRRTRSFGTLSRNWKLVKDRVAMGKDRQDG